MGTLCCGMANVLVVLTVFSRVPFGSIFSHRWGPLEGNLAFIREVDMFSGVCQVYIEGVRRPPRVISVFGPSLVAIPWTLVHPPFEPSWAEGLTWDFFFLPISSHGHPRHECTFVLSRRSHLGQ